MATAAARTFLIAYEIARPGEARTSMAEAIMSLGDAWARPLDTVWMVRTNRPAEDIETCLTPLLGENDGLMVQETRGEAHLANAGLRWFRPRARPADGSRVPASVAAAPPSRERDLVWAA